MPRVRDHASVDSSQIPSENTCDRRHKYAHQTLLSKQRVALAYDESDFYHCNNIPVASYPNKYHLDSAWELK